LELGGLIEAGYDVQTHDGLARFGDDKLLPCEVMASHAK
jgi:hypothetical protein